MIFVVIFFGLLVGSFLNVLILRGDSGNKRHKRSICLSCGGELKNRDLFPVISFLILKGRCRHCKCLISWQYPIVELLSACLFLVSFFYVFKNIFTYSSVEFAILDWILLTVISSVSIVIVIYDLQHKIILDKFALILFVTAFLRVVLIYFFTLNNQSLLLEISAGILAPLPFFILWLISKGEWIGLGDAKVMAGLGLLTGWHYFVSSIILAFWLGTLFILSLFLLKIVSTKISVLRFKGLFSVLKMKAEIPFAPFLVISALITLFFEFNVLNFISGVLV
jgi:leader peptidase (prepilin peptidase)/N-methyltransferase